MLDFQVSTIVFTVINLLVLYFILRKLLFGRVNAVLERAGGPGEGDHRLRRGQQEPGGGAARGV
ncbi:MAG: hypothetical protein ACLRNQ_11685 [Flavonifractor plautii]